MSHRYVLKRANKLQTVKDRDLKKNLPLGAPCEGGQGSIFRWLYHPQILMDHNFAAIWPKEIHSTS